MSYRSPNAYLESHPFFGVRKSIRELLIKHLFAHPKPQCTGAEFIEAIVPEHVKDSMRTLHAWNVNAMNSDCNPDFYLTHLPWQKPNERHPDSFKIRVSIPTSFPYRIGNSLALTANNTPDNPVIQGYIEWAAGYIKKWNACSALYLYVTGALCATNTPGQLLNLWPSIITFLDEDTKKALNARVRTSPLVRDEGKRAFLEMYYHDKMRERVDQALTVAMLISANDSWFRECDIRITRNELWGESPHLFDNPPTEFMPRIIECLPNV